MNNRPAKNEKNQAQDTSLAASKDQQNSAEYGSQPLIMKWAKSRQRAEAKGKDASSPEDAETRNVTDLPPTNTRLLWSIESPQPEDSRSRELVRLAANALRLEDPEKR